MKKKLMMLCVLSALAFCISACSSPFQAHGGNGSEDVSEAVTSLPEGEASGELVDAIKDLPVDPVDAVKNNEGQDPVKEDQPDEALDAIQDLPEDVIDRPSAPANGYVLTEKEVEGEEMENGGFLVRHVTSDKKDIVLPDEIDGHPVTEIGEYAFAQADYENITLPDTVKVIGEGAFVGCSSLKTVNFGNSLERTGFALFIDCNKIESIALPDSVKSMDGYIAGGCENLKTVYVPASVTEFGDDIKLIGIATCPKAVVVTPEGSAAEAVCKEGNIPYRNESGMPEPLPVFPYSETGD